MKKVRIKNYNFYPCFEGQIGEIIQINFHTYYVRMPNGVFILPYKEDEPYAECELVEEFVLPENWWVRVDKTNKEILSEWRKTSLDVHELVGMCKWKDGRIIKCHNPIDTPKSSSFDFGNEITFEQFKTHVLKQNIMNKKIVGYKFKSDCKQFEKAAFELVKPTDIANFEEFTEDSGMRVNMTANCKTKVKLEAAGVLDLWFEPVYGEEEVIIEGIKAEIDNRKVKFGCQEFSKETLKGLIDFCSRTEFKPSISVNNTEITLPILQKLYKML